MKRTFSPALGWAVGLSLVGWWTGHQWLEGGAIAILIWADVQKAIAKAVSTLCEAVDGSINRMEERFEQHLEFEIKAVRAEIDDLRRLLDRRLP